MSLSIVEIKLNKLDYTLSSIKKYCNTTSQDPQDEPHSISATRKDLNSMIDDCISLSQDFYLAFSSGSELSSGENGEGIKAPTAQRGINKNPSSTTNLLSLQQMRVVYTAIEVLWLLVLKSFISSNDSTAGFQLPEANLAKSIMLSSDNLRQFAAVMSGDGDGDDDGYSEWNFSLRARAIRCLHVVADIAMHEMFAAHMLDRNLNRILLCALTLQHISATENSGGFASKEMVRRELSAYMHIFCLTATPATHPAPCRLQWQWRTSCLTVPVPV